MSKSGNRLDVNVDNISIEVFNDALRIASGVLGTGLSGGSGSPISIKTNLTHVTGLGTISSGVWNANIVDVPYGGTGVNTFPTDSILYGNGISPIATSSTFTFTNSRLNVPNVIINATTASNSASTGALVVRGGTGISGDLYVTGNASFTGNVTVKDPVNPSDATSRSYVDSIIATAGTGLTKTGTTFSINTTQPQITTVGTLTGLNSSGIVRITDSTESTSATTGSFVTVGGIGLGGSLNVGTNLYVTGTTTLTGTVVVPKPQSATEAANRFYVDSLISVGGTGLTKTGNVFSVNPTQSQITSLGTLTSLEVSGLARITNTTDSTNSTTGSLVLGGGMGIGGSLQVAGLVGIQSNLSVAGTFNVSNVAQSTSVGTGSVVIAGGLGLSGNLNSSGVVTLFNTTQSTSPTTGALVVYGGAGITGNLTVLGKVTVPSPANGTDAVNLDYLNSKLATAGTGLTKTGTTFSVNATQPQIVQVGTLTLLSVSGQTTFTNTTVSTSGSTGSVVFSGGVGILGKVFSENDIQTTGQILLTNTSVSSSTTTGAIVVSGGLGLAGSAYVGTNLRVLGTSTFSGVVTVPVPVNATDAGRKDYIDGLSYLIAGTGLTKTGVTLSVNASQTQITTVGTLTGLTSSGAVVITNNTAASSTTTGALLVSGGVGIVGSTFIGGNLSITGTSTLTGKVTVPVPTAATDAGRKDYIDGLTYFTAGTGLTKTGATLTVNASQTQITTVGTLTGLTSSGAVAITNATVSSSATTGALRVTGGIGTSGSVYVGTNLVVTGTTNLTGVVTVPLPVNTTDAGRKDYIDGLTYLTAGTGLTKTGGTLSINASQTQITTVGTLTGLTSSGAVAITDTTLSTSSTTGAFVVGGGVGVGGEMFVSGNATFSSKVTVPIPVNGTDAGRKDYIDGLTYLTAGTGLTKSGSTLSVNASQPQITDVGTLTKLDVSGVTTFSGTVTVPTPVNGTDAVNKAYTDSLVQGLSIKNSVTAASTGPVNLSLLALNATLDGVVLAVGNRILLKDQTNPIENGIYVIAPSAPPPRSADMATNVNATGIFSFVQSGTVNASSGWVVTNQSGNARVGTDAIFFTQFSAAGQSAGPGLNVDGTSIEIVNDTLRLSSGIIGSGLSGGSGTAISVNAAQPGITSVGTLTGLTVSGTSTLSNITATGTVIVPVPSATNQASTKGYTDGLSYLTAGTGLTKTGGTLSVNASQTQITAVGTLTLLTSSGVVSITNNTAATSTTTGALRVTGGTGIAGALYVGGISSFASTITVPSPVNATDAGRKDYIDGLTYLTAGTGLTKTGGTLSVNASQTQITTLGTLTGVTSAGVVNITNTTISTSATSGALLVAGGVGVSGSLVCRN